MICTRTRHSVATRLTTLATVVVTALLGAVALSAPARANAPGSTTVTDVQVSPSSQGAAAQANYAGSALRW